MGLLLAVSGCASGTGERALGGGEPDGAGMRAGPGALFESNVPFAARCASGQVLVCESDAGGHACGCMHRGMAEQQLPGFSGDMRQNSMR